MTASTEARNSAINFSSFLSSSSFCATTVRKLAPPSIEPSDHGFALTSLDTAEDAEDAGEKPTGDERVDEVAGAIEDHAANTAFAVKKISSILDNLYYLSAIELIHGAQAVTLRGNPRLGEKTRKLYTSFREIIPALYEDRDQSADIEKSRQFVQDAIDNLI